ncbi:hypothetical protein SAMN05660653_00802 [Desulfonatronum thiosulfatophilum]|uniref:Uncharacterized protein n=1 Tax=Desulfonatronum thiosulfatophilum TaxID=617002 RepID=A0A1G6B8R7_9BACT|nr:hypothetical protein SAMN05660653_00802 [Desulfonatronum thiosulfatophilum]
MVSCIIAEQVGPDPDLHITLRIGYKGKIQQPQALNFVLSFQPGSLQGTNLAGQIIMNGTQPGLQYIENCRPLFRNADLKRLKQGCEQCC